MLVNVRIKVYQGDASSLRNSFPCARDYLNQLASRGFLKKERHGREVYFLVFALYTMCPNCGAQVIMTSDRCPMCGAVLSKREH